MASFGIHPADMYLPAPGIDQKKWAVVACDQFTSDAAYWQRLEEEVGSAPSALRIVYPEVYLSEGEARIPMIRAAMEQYMADGVLTKQVAAASAWWPPLTWKIMTTPPALPPPSGPRKAPFSAVFRPG